MKIEQKEYFNGKDPNIFGEEIVSNSVQLLSRVNILLADYAEWLLERDHVLKPQKASVRSGIRTRQENTAIYVIINNRLVAKGLEPIPEATDSAHLHGLAVDIADDYDLFKEYLETERAKKIYEPLDLYFEDFSATDTPASGHRFFKP